MIDSWETATEAERARVLIHEIGRAKEAACPDCGRSPCGHEYLVNVVMGTKDRPRCAGCLSRGLGRERGDLLEQVREYVMERECFREAWSWAGRDEGCGAAEWPPCLWPEAHPDAEAARARAVESPGPSRGDALSFEGAVLEPADSWDAGDMSCGDLLLELRVRMGRLAPGDLLELRALDRGARKDLPAWCRLTGELLVRARHPLYWIQRCPPDAG